MHLCSLFHRKLAPMPFELADPVWIEDDDVDLDYHVRSVTLRRPGTMAQLELLISRLHSSLLDRSRPLWEIYVIDGLENGQIGYYTKAHHSGIDGKASACYVTRVLLPANSGGVIAPVTANTVIAAFGDSHMDGVANNPVSVNGWCGQLRRAALAAGQSLVYVGAGSSTLCGDGPTAAQTAAIARMRGLTQKILPPASIWQSGLTPVRYPGSCSANVIT